MRTFKLYWSPEGKHIATVRANTVGAAIRKAPAPYRQYLGEIYATDENGQRVTDTAKREPLTADVHNALAQKVTLAIEGLHNGSQPVQVIHYDGKAYVRWRSMTSKAKAWQRWDDRGGRWMQDDFLSTAVKDAFGISRHKAVTFLYVANIIKLDE